MVSQGDGTERKMITMILQTMAASVGTVAFCVLYRVPGKYFLDCGFVGMLEWIVYLLVNHLFKNETLAVFFATLTIVVLSRYLSVKKKCPMSMFLIPGIFPLVPGAKIYHMTYTASLGAYTRAFYYCMEAFKAAFAIAMAIAIGSRIPAKWFREKLRCD